MLPTREGVNVSTFRSVAVHLSNCRHTGSEVDEKERRAVGEGGSWEMSWMVWYPRSVE